MINPKMTQNQVNKMDASHYQQADRDIADNIDMQRHGNEKTDAKHRAYHSAMIAEQCKGQK